MSADVFIKAIKPPDETWKKHKAVVDACTAAGVEVPEATMDYFEGYAPHAEGVAIDLGSMAFPTGAAKRVVHYGVLIDLTELRGVRYIKLVWAS